MSLTAYLRAGRQWLEEQHSLQPGLSQQCAPGRAAAGSPPPAAPAVEIGSENGPDCFAKQRPPHP